MEKSLSLEEPTARRFRRPRLTWLSYVLALTVAVFCHSAHFIAAEPIQAETNAPASDHDRRFPVDCEKVGTTAVTNSARRIEIIAQGYSVLPPQGESWCFKLLTSHGVSFFKLPSFENIIEQPPSRDEVAAIHLFSAIAPSLKGLRDFETNPQSPAEIKTAVELLLHEHLFSQILMGVITAAHRFRLLESDIVPDSYSGASCVRFRALIEERGNSQNPNLVFKANLPHNIVCRHPTAPEIGLIWLGFAERYTQADQTASDDLKQEYEPFAQSLQFMSPR